MRQCSLNGSGFCRPQSHSHIWPDLVKSRPEKHVTSNAYAGSSPRRAFFHDVPGTRPPTNADQRCFQPLPRASMYRSENCSTPSQMTMLRFGTICSSHCRAFRPQRSRVMKKQRGATQAEKEFDAEVANFNQEARKILDDRSLSMSARRRLISLKGKALLRPSVSGSQSSSTR